MWFIEGTVNNTKFSKLIYQRTKRDDNDTSKQINIPFIIGRREGDLVYSSDRRVSRIHAHINIENPSNRNSNHKPKLYLTDLSKFGTKINNASIQKNQRNELHENDSICVGIPTSTFIVKWIPFIVLFSKIPSEQRKSIKILIHKMGGQIAINNEWNNNITHLFVPKGTVNVTQKVISAMIHGKQIVTIDWLKYVLKNNSFPLEKDKQKYIPSNVYEWLEKGYKNELKYNIKREELFLNKLFIFIDDKLLKMHGNIIKQCSGNVILLNKNELINKIENEIKYRNDIKEYCIFDDNDYNNNNINGYTYFKSCCIANAICCCDGNGSEQEIKWYKTQIKKENNNNNENDENETENENNETENDVLDLLMMDVNDEVDSPVKMEIDNKNNNNNNKSNGVQNARNANNNNRNYKKRKREDIDMNVTDISNEGGNEVLNEFESPPIKKHKSNVAKTQIISPQIMKEYTQDSINDNNNNNIKELTPRKLNSSSFVSIKRLKEERNRNVREGDVSSQCTIYTNMIYRNLSIVMEREKKMKQIEMDNNKNNKNKNKKNNKTKSKGKRKVIGKGKKLEFKDLKGRKSLKNEFENEDIYYDENNMLEKQKELYSNDNILGIQKEFIEMDLIVNTDNDLKLDNENDNNTENNKQIFDKKLPSIAFELPNYKAFKGNKNYLQAMENKLKDIVEFDYDFNNKNNYDDMNQQFDDNEFKKQREEEEKQENEIKELFQSKKKGKKVKTPPKRKKNNKKKGNGKKAGGRKRKRKEIEKHESSEDEIEIVEKKNNRNNRKRKRLNVSTKSRRKRK